MTIELNIDRLGRHPDVPGEHTDAEAPESSIYGAITGQVAVGRYALQIGGPCGAVVREASRGGRPRHRPRPTPILLRPRLIRGLLDRRTELAAAFSALDAGLPLEVSGEPGVGKSAVLRHLAHHPRAASFPDGIVYVSARHQSSADLLQLVFEAFYESDTLCKPTQAEIQRGLQETRALILLDDVRLPQNELEEVLEIAPKSAFAVATRERCLWGEVRSVALTALPMADAMLLLEREIERSLDLVERSAAEHLCAAVGGHPLRIRQAAAIIHERGISRDGGAGDMRPTSLIAELVSSADEKQRRALMALTALPGVPLTVQHVAGIADVTDIEPSLMTLVRRGLVVRSLSRHRLVDGVSDQLRRTEDLRPWVNRAITYFTVWAERSRRSANDLLEESEALLAAQQCAADNRRWGEVLRLGRLLEGALIVGARWGAWATTLERCLAAAKATTDRSAEAWALHEIGTRAVCLGGTHKARASLDQAVKLREALDDKEGAAVSRQNLSVVLAPISIDSRDRSTLRFVDVGSKALHSGARPAIRVRRTNRIGALSFTVVLFAILGWFLYQATSTGLFGRSGIVASVRSLLQGGVDAAPADTAIAPSSWREATEPGAISLPIEGDASAGDLAPTPPAVLGPVSTRTSILIFTARPGSIATAQSTELCYAVSDAVRARIEPDIGEVSPTSTLTCLRVAPLRTTTYALTASGSDGYEIREQLVIVVM